MAVRAYEDATGLQRALRRVGASPAGSWVLRRTLHHADRVVHRLTGHRATLAERLVGLPTAMLTTTGARSGEPRTVPVLAVEVPDGWGVVASSFGQARHPGWYHNLRADPRAVIEIAGRRHDVVATQVHGGEREEVRAAALLIYPGYTVYEGRAAPRDLGYFVLWEAPSVLREAPSPVTMTPSFLELLTAWLPTQPWYAGPWPPQLRRVAGLRFEDPEGEVGMEVHVVADGSGRHPVVYAVPLTKRDAPLPGLEHALVGTSVHSVLGLRWIHDGEHDPVFLAALADRLSGGPDRHPTFGLVRVLAPNGPGSVDDMHDRVLVEWQDPATGATVEGPLAVTA